MNLISSEGCGGCQWSGEQDSQGGEIHRIMAILSTPISSPNLLLDPVAPTGLTPHSGTSPFSHFLGPCHLSVNATHLRHYFSQANLHFNNILKAQRN